MERLLVLKCAQHEVTLKLSAPSLAKFAVVVSALTLVTCGDVCSCPPVPPESEVFGVVVDADEQPVAGAVVRSYARATTCPATSPAATPWPFDRSIITDVQGRYVLFGAKPPAQFFCLRVIATRDSGRDSVVVENVVTGALTQRPRSFRVDLAFPN